MAEQKVRCSGADKCNGNACCHMKKHLVHREVATGHLCSKWHRCRWFYKSVRCVRAEGEGES